MISALAPAWQYQAVVDLGHEPMVLDVEEATGLVGLETIQNTVTGDGQELKMIHLQSISRQTVCTTVNIFSQIL